MWHFVTKKCLMYGCRMIRRKKTLIKRKKANIFDNLIYSFFSVRIYYRHVNGVIHHIEGHVAVEMTTFVLEYCPYINVILNRIISVDLKSMIERIRLTFKIDCLPMIQTDWPVKKYENGMLVIVFKCQFEVRRLTVFRFHQFNFRLKNCRFIALSSVQNKYTYLIHCY